MRDKISDLLIHKAVDVWCKKLLTPVFDNGDTSAMGGFGAALATINIQSDKKKINNMADCIEKFRMELTTELLRLRDHPNDGEYFPRYLDVDYHPCNVLAEAAKKAGIPRSQLSCKSSVSMYDDRVITSFGYAAPHINHYPLPDGKWLETDLSGKDIAKIIDSVVNGSNPLNFTVES